MKISQKLIFGFVGIAFLSWSIAFFSLQQIVKISDSSFKDIPESLIRIKESSHLNELAQLISYYDEVLTQAARNYAFTQDDAWEKRYYQIEPKLDEVITEAIEQGDAKDKEFFASINEANLALVAMEIRAIRLVNVDMPEDAVRILESAEYWNQKRIYSQALKSHMERRGIDDQEAILNSVNMVESSMERTRLLVQHSAQSILLISIIVLILGIGLSVWIARSISIPIGKLKKAAEDVSEDKMDVDIDITSKDEVGNLSRSFKMMVAQLQLHKERLVRDTLYINSILHAAGECIVVMSAEGIIETFNRTAENVFGFEAQEAIGKDVKTIIPAFYQEKHDEVFKRFSPSEDGSISGKGGIELQGMRKDGSTFPIEVTITAMTLPDTRRKVYIGVIRDISESKTIKEALEMTARFPDENPNPILRIAKDGTILYANKCSGSLLEAWGLTVYSKVNNRWFAIMQEVLKSNKIEIFEEKYDDTIYSLNVVPIKGDDYVNIYAYDITDLHKATIGLQESEMRFSSIVRAAVDGIITVDNRGIIQLFNPAAQKIFGYTRDEAVGQSVKMLLAPDIDRSEYQKYLSIYTKSGEEKIIGGRQEILGRHKKGNMVPIDLSLSEIVMTNGQRMFIAIVRDITERKKAEEEIKKVMEAKDEFSSMVSHELRTPLAISKEALSLILRRKLGKVPVKQEEVIQMAGANIERLQILINNILDATKLNAGKMILSKESVNINDVVKESFHEWKMQAEAKNIKFDLKTSDKAIVMFVDTIRVMQILTNLISNALKFTPESGTVTVKVEEATDEVKFTIEDSGKGIAREEIPKVFDKFYQLDRSHEPGGQGTGLGLNISKSLIELHGGQIFLTSEVNKGTIVNFTLPKAEPLQKV